MDQIQQPGPHRDSEPGNRRPADSGTTTQSATSPPELREFHYRVSWRSRSAIPGHHPGICSGGGYEFYGHAPLISNPQPRNLDIHASLLDPFGQFVVRTFRQRGTIPVHAVADLSASMGASRPHGKMPVLAGIVRATAYSASRTGDPFGFAGFTDQLHRDLLVPLRWHKGIPTEPIRRLAAFKPAVASADGLLQAASLIGKRRALVFLLSDFHFPLQRTEEILRSLCRHDVVPVVLWDAREIHLPAKGLCRLADAETGRERLLFMRPRLQQEIRRAFETRRSRLEALFKAFGRPPFFVTDEFHADQMTRYFYPQ